MKLDISNAVQISLPVYDTTWSQHGFCESYVSGQNQRFLQAKTTSGMKNTYKDMNTILACKLVSRC